MKPAKPFNLPHNEKESDLHKSVATLLDWVLIPPTFFTTFPAGWGKLNKATAGRLYASGLKPGMPDIFIFAEARVIENKKRPIVIGIELKVGANSVSSAQRTMFAKLYAVGIRVYICRNIDDVIAALREAGIPHRANKDAVHEITRAYTPRPTNPG
ncbi:MAG TPA: VRR-NUC domain-containing protein [Xanthobacteraceae bacterium]